MSDPNERIIKPEGGHISEERLVRLHPEKLPSAPDETPQRRSERKYNMRIKRQDLTLLDELAKADGRPRSELINELLHNILLKELNSISKIDARLLIALTADRDATYNDLARPWSFDALMEEIEFIAGNVMAHGHTGQEQNEHNRPLDEFHSEEFISLRAKLEEAQR